MKTIKIFSTAALALMLAACSSEDTALNNTPAQEGQKVPFTATIAAPGSGAGTRTEYTEVTSGDAAGTINVAWKAGDEIALIHNGKADVVKVETVNEDGSATITGDITVGTDGEAIEVCYPAALWEWAEKSELVEKSGAIRNETFVTNITTKQDGTLKYIQDNLDTRMGKGTLKVDGDKATLSDNVTLASQIAIWKLTMQDDATPTPAALKATQVSVKLDGETPVTKASTAKLSTATSTVYLAMPEMAEPETTVTIEAATADGTYIYENSGLTLKAGYYYQSTVSMEEAVWDGDLSSILTSALESDGKTLKIATDMTLTGTLTDNYKITIADGATVTLDNVSINADGTWISDNWAGITCEGDATIILEDGSTNTVTGFNGNYPGIYVPGDAENPANNKTLTIKGTGSLTASSNGYGAGIGGGMSINCGNIIIEGGTITANGGQFGAGIGSGSSSNCGNITISGGTITANGGQFGAGIGSGNEGKCVDILISGGTIEATGKDGGVGIGSGYDGSCGDITITKGVTKVTATKDSGLETVGRGNNGSCTSVSIGGTVYWNGSAYQNGGGTYLTQSPFEYSPIPATAHTLAASVVGDVVDTDGNAYTLDATHVLPSGVTAVAMICYVGDNGEDAPYNHGLALALTDESSSGMKWEAAKTACNTTKNTSIPVTNARWLLASKDQWGYMSSAVLSNLGLQNKWYWSSTTYSSEPFLQVWAYQFSNNSWSQFDGRDVGVNNRVRACLAF